MTMAVISAINAAILDELEEVENLYVLNIERSRLRDHSNPFSLSSCIFKKLFRFEKRMMQDIIIAVIALFMRQTLYLNPVPEHLKIPSPPPPTSNQGNTSTDLEKHVTILETQDNSTHFTQALENVAKKLAKICQRLDAIEENQRKILEKVGNECSEPVQEVQNLPEGLIPLFKFR
ncbi:hypothetical protein FQA39_LY18532 [Lamprigera yunnana]|nr:hypothetical protein FQA39_LY18532 [Lamprigera yunnana]